MTGSSIIVPTATAIVAVSPEAMHEIHETVRQLLALNDPQQVVELSIALAGQLDDVPHKAAFELALRGTASLGAGFSLAQQADFAGAGDRFRSAHANFSAVDIPDARSIAYAFQCYVDGTRNAMLLNLNQARAFWDEAERYLKEEGGLQEKYRILLEQFKPDQLFVAALNAIIQQDFGTAQSLLQEASIAAKDFADKYVPTEDPNHQFLKGLSQFYIAFYNLADSMREFISCGYDRLIDRRTDLIATATRAQSLLEKQSYPNAIQKRIGTTAAAVLRLQDILLDFSEIMKDAVLASVNRQPSKLVDLRRKLGDVRTLVGGLGPSGVVLLRQCDQLSRQADNIERLTKPTVKDFGLFSGLVAMIAFVPLLLVTSWIFDHFKWGVPPTTVIWVNVAVACVVGFGAGAFKLIPSLMGGKSKD